MAYLDLTATHPFMAISCVAAPRKLSGQERSVVLLSRNDPLWSLRPRHTHSKLLRFLFGIEAPHSLADQRLEALRHYAVTYRLRDEGVHAAEGLALEQGYAVNQLSQVRHMVDGVRAARARGSAGLVGHALFALIAVLIFAGATAWFSSRFDSNLISFVFVAVGGLSLASFAAKEPVRR